MPSAGSLRFLVAPNVSHPSRAGVRGVVRDARSAIESQQNARRCWSNNTGASAGATLETRRGDFGRAATCAAGEALAFHPREVTDGQVTRQRPGAGFRRRRVDAAALVSPRRAGAHRHEIRLRHRPMRLLHRPYRRPGGPVIAAEFLPARAFAYATGADKMPHGVVSDPHVFISIDPNGIVTIVAHRSEMGTGSRTSLPMVVADELEADWSRVRVAQAPGNEEKYGNQDTDGSRSMRHFIQPMRQCGAACRQMLESAAAKRWGVDVKEVEAKNHEVFHRSSGKKLGYGELAADASALPTPAEDKIKLKDAASFRYIGKGNTPIVDLFDITTGAAIYGIDAKMAGMKYAVIARPPGFGGKLASHDASAAMKVPGVEKVVVIEGTPAPAKCQPLGGVAVVAGKTWAARQGRDALKLT